MLLNKIFKLGIPFTQYCSRSKMHTKVLLENGIKTITLCHSKTRNSLSIEMMETLIKNINEDQCNKEMRVMIIDHEGPIFSSGHNLKELCKDAGTEQHEKVFELASTLMNSIIDCPVPVIAKVNGVAAAAGCQLVAQCDLAVCTEKSLFSTPGANVGIFCSTPGVALSRCVSRKNALYMLLTGLPISACEAWRIGLINTVCDTPKSLDQQLEEICNAIKSKSRSVIKKGKSFFYEQNNLQNIRDAYEKGAAVMSSSCSAAAGQHGIECFIKKQKPIWTD